MDEIDIWRAAATALKLHGEDAAPKAAMRADELREGHHLLFARHAVRLPKMVGDTFSELLAEISNLGSGMSMLSNRFPRLRPS